MTVWIYERETDAIEVFASEAAAIDWLKANDPEGVAFEFALTVRNGEKRFLFEYPYEGGEYALEIPADDEAEAKAKLMAIPWAKYKGEIAATIPLNPLRWWHWRP